MNHNLIEKLLSRKFIASLFALFSATWLMYTDHIADGVYATVVVATIGAYITGNVVQKTTKKETP